MKFLLLISLILFVGCSQVDKNKDITKRDPAARPMNLENSFFVKFLLNKIWKVECSLIDTNIKRSVVKVIDGAVYEKVDRVVDYLVDNHGLPSRFKTREANRYYEGENLAVLLSMAYDKVKKNMAGSLRLVFHYEKDTSRFLVEGLPGQPILQEVSVFKSNVFPEGYGTTAKLIEGIKILFRDSKENVSLRFSLSTSTDRLLGVLLVGNDGAGSCVMEEST